MRRLLFLASISLVAWASVGVQLPFYEIRPGGSHPVEDLIELSASAGDINGDLALLTIRQIQTTPVDAIGAMLSGDRQLRPAAERTPPDVDRDVYVAAQSQAFDNAFRTAIAVAARAAGYDIEVTTAAVIGQVLIGSPSDGLLRPGDEVAAIDGTPIDSANALVTQLRTRSAGDDVVLGLVRDGEPTEVSIRLTLLEATDRAGLGVVVETVAGPLELPFDATLDEVRIGGPSAGLMIALTAVDLLLDEDLAAGRSIAGTGTIAGDGTIGTIGGIEQKVEAALDGGATLMLVPFEQTSVATIAADGRLEVVGVASLTDAIEALRQSAAKTAPARG
jgi:PDZ domain-containing protein